VLYTERPDQVGEIAKKIEGHNQSLELGDMKYVINYDERKHLKNIEITAGQIIGVSVLGSNERPAFTGSQFFSYNPDFEQKMRLLKNYCEQESIGQNNGGNEMNLQEFMKLSWGEISTKVSKAIEQEYVNEYYTMVVDMFKEHAIVRFYSLIDGSNKLMKVKYAVQKDGSITLGNVNEVYVSYNDYAEAKEEEEKKDEEETFAKVEAEEDEDKSSETSEEDEKEDEEDKEESEKTFEAVDEEEEKKDEDDKSTESDDSQDAEEDDEEKEKEKEADEFDCSDEGVSEAVSDISTMADAVDSANCVNDSEEAAPDEYAKAPTDDEVKEEDEDEDEDKSKDPSGFASFTQSERAELEELKKEKKINLLDSYKEVLTEEEYDSYKADISNFSEEGLELELLRKFKLASGKTKKTTRMFAFDPSVKTTNASADSLDSVVSKYIRG
jgi:hypothetical protein